MIRLRNATFRYHAESRPVFENLDLDIQKGDTFIIRGHNGSGKTTLLKILAGTAPKFTGGILTGDREVFGHATEIIDPREIGVVFSGLNQPSIHARVGQELLHILEIHLESKTDIQTQYENIASLFEIQDLLDKNIDDLSSGEHQLFKIALAFLLSPRVVFMDEPLSHLDLERKEKLLAILKRIKNQKGVTYVIADHDSAAWSDLRIDQIFDVGTPNKSPRLKSTATVHPKNVQSEVLAIEHIDFSYGPNRIFKNRTWRLHRGEFVAVTGKNGSGKTTLLNLMMGHLKPQNGGIFRKQSDLSVRMLVNPVHENFFSMKFKDEIHENHGGSDDPFDIFSLKDRYVNDLSQGEQRKAALTILLDSPTDVLLLDEPFLHLDQQSCVILENEIIKRREKGMAVIFTTHNLHNHHVDQVWNLDE